MRRIVVATACLTLFAAGGCGKPAQIGSDEEAHKAVDALFTALTAKDTQLLDKCEKRLDELTASGKLPNSAREALGTIIGKARAGKWETAAERLYDFIQGQETGPAHTPREHPKPGRKK
jgi:hypothetical protein